MKIKCEIRPTGTCFEDVTWMFIQMLRENPNRLNGEFWMVHGICLLLSGKRYSHAWIEEDGTTWFSGIMEGKTGFIQTPTDQFYTQFHVQERTRYTAIEARDRALLANNIPPPWEPKYRELCKDYVPN